MSESWPFAELQMFGYHAILADPPWRFGLRSVKGEEKSPQAQYDCMALDDIKALPVGQLARDHCWLMLWATWPMIREALEVMDAWGFTYVTGGSWAKQSKTGAKWAFGTGYVMRSADEPFLIGRIGNPPIRTRSLRNLIVAPVREHSRKPDAQYDHVEQLAHGPYAELFSRTSRTGWDSWGNQTGRFTAEAA